MEYKLILYIFLMIIMVTGLISTYKDNNYILYVIFSLVFAYEIHNLILIIIELNKQT